MKQRLLIVDDEPGIVDMMASYFSSQYEVLTAYCGNEALQKLARQPDLILLDINMPDIDGLTLCQKIRELITCPILFLTARVESADKIIGFQAGADDYIIKPFDLDELGARVAAHLRREQRHRNKATIRFFGELTIDYSARTVTVAGEPVALSKREYDKQNFQSIIYALAEDLNVDERYIQYNWVLLDAIGISYDEAADSDTGTGFSFMTAACILVGVLVLLAAGLVIYNILKISITKRIKEYGTLRAIGGERGQIYRLVSLQLLILCGAGIPIGLLLGILSAKGVLIAATGLLNPDLFMANSTSELNSAINTASTVKLPMLFASIAVILLFALLAAFPAARYASHVSPTVAMSGQTVKIKRRIKRNRNIRNFEAYYARLNLKRGRGRTAVTILSLVMSITVFVALQSFTGLLDASSSVQDMYFSDYAVTNETVGIPSEAVKTLAENDAVESVSTTRLSVFMPGAGDILPFETDLSVQSHETLQLVNVDEAQLQIYAPNLSAQDKQALKDGTGCLVKNPIAFSYGDTTVQQTDLTVGDTIQLGDRTLPVLGLIDTAITINNDGFTNGVQLIVNDEIYCSLLGNDSYSEVYPTLQDNADTDTFESWLDSWCSNYPGTHWLSYLQSSNEMIESFEQIKMLCWVLIIFIGIIGILNIINTVYSNIHTRVGEIGMQRAIGMSAASLYKTFLWEGAYYGIIASVIGAVFGYVCCIFVGAAQTDALQLVAVPVMAIVEAAIISIVACLLATAIPLRSIARMSIVDSIETVE